MNDDAEQYYNNFKIKLDDNKTEIRKNHDSEFHVADCIDY